MTIRALHHIQLAMPPGGEPAARSFYSDCLGLLEIEKPAHLAKRGGCWFERDDVRVHLGIEAEFRPARKAHPAFLVEDVRRLAAALEEAGYGIVEDEPLDGFDRVHVDDPFGNRIELLQDLMPADRKSSAGVSPSRRAGSLRGRIALTPAFFDPLPADELAAWTGETEDMAHATFALHPQLQADTLAVGDLGLSRVLLVNDARFPWLILVPRRAELVEIVDLGPHERRTLMNEIAACSAALKRIAAPDKLNVGAIGNRVAQLHVHVVARFVGDAAWPDPVWGRGPAVPYAGEAGASRALAIWSALALV